jgi:hypothetical protein
MSGGSARFHLVDYQVMIRNWADLGWICSNESRNKCHSGEREITRLREGSGVTGIKKNLLRTVDIAGIVRDVDNVLRVVSPDTTRYLYLR